jgi:[glutamine synthetase] adenylyltransferase / [glutamine synthetase]-adenylyl-L-tyrosine phosphorylase
MVVEQSHITAPSTEEELYFAIGKLAADAGLSPPLFLRLLKADVRATAHPRRALTSFHRFLMTGFTSAWLRDFYEHRLLQRILLEISAQSQFLADILVRNPELFRWLTSSIVLKVTKTREEYASEVNQAVSLFQRSEKKLDALKRFQRRELLRIGVRQILKEADVLTTSRELSALADSIIEAVLQLAYEHIHEVSQGDAGRDLAIIGLGKLGGEELNFSSDIDLMFVYNKDDSVNGVRSHLTTAHEYYSRVSEYVVRRLSEHTGEGHFYRVDMRLRPDGFSGPLAMSRSTYIAYYETRGELWERQMLIKARVVAGNRNIGKGWREDIRPFIYPKTLLASPLMEIAKIKSRIESNVGVEEDIKLGSGGIRDIEFTVQALQLLNGGNNLQLQQRNTVTALERLAEARFLETREGSDLTVAYKFLRTVEDRLQLLHGLQTHSLPESSEERRILARQLGYRGEKAFSGDLEYHRSRIRAVFRSVVGAQVKKGELRLRASDTLHGGVKAIRLPGFLNAAAARDRLEKITAEVPQLGPLEQLPLFLQLVKKHRAQDWCIENFVLLASSGPIKRTLQQAVSSSRALELILLICSRSSKYATLLSREPLLFEALVGRPEDLIGPGASWTFLRSSDLIRYRVYNEFKSVVRFIVSEISIRELTRELSELAEEIIIGALEQARMDVARAGQIPVALIGLGKLGGKELSVGSDLDLILLHKETSSEGTSKIVNALGRRFVEVLQGVYEVDLRLRPEGKNAPLVTGFEYYKKYLADRASLWERQSLLKARSVGGDPEFGREVMEHIHRFSYYSPLPRMWKREIIAMRQRIERERPRQRGGIDLKLGVGGLVDLEFAAQSIQLRLGSDKARLINTSSFEVIQALRGARIVKAADVTRIDRNLNYLRRLEAYVRMNSESTEFVLPEEDVRLQAVIAAMGGTSTKAFSRDIKRVRSENRSLFNTIIKALPK